MADFTIVQSKDEILPTIQQKLSEGYVESEISVLSKTKLHFDELHDSEVNLTATSGSFSDKMAKILTGEDGEETVLAYYDINDYDKERFKKELLDNNFLVVATRDNSSHEEVQKANAAYAGNTVEDKHYEEETNGPKS